MFWQQQKVQHTPHTHTKYTQLQFIHLMFKQKPKLLLIFLIPTKEIYIQHDNNLANFVYNGFDTHHTHRQTHTYTERHNNLPWSPEYR